MLLLGDCLEVLPHWPDCTFDVVCTDPPYGLTSGPTKTLSKDGGSGGGFMGKHWDHGVPGVEYWREVLRVAKPGAYLTAFGGTRTYHRLVCAIEDAGWEVRDCLMWLYGCLSDDTEILVDGEWVGRSAVAEGKKALCYDVEKQEYSWLPIDEVVVYDYDDVAFRIQSDDTDQLVSRNHRCVVERDGSYTFIEAEEAARQQSVRVPVVEDVQGLLHDLPVSHARASKEEAVLQPIVFGETAASQETVDRAFGNDGNLMCCMRQERLARDQPRGSRQDPDVQLPLQRRVAREGVGQARAQRLCELDESEPRAVTREDDGAEQSGVERRCCEAVRVPLRQVPDALVDDGPQRRLRDGTSACGCDCAGTTAETSRGSSSSGPRFGEQRAIEPRVVQVEPRPQAVRDTRHTRTRLARITETHYRGVMWCIRVPTKAFVARRNGKVFVTGNTGFPKSHNVEKALRKAGDDRLADCYVGYGTALKPSYEIIVCAVKPPTDDETTRELSALASAIDAAPTSHLGVGGRAYRPDYETIILARKPLAGTVAQNVQQYGTGGLNVDASRARGGGPSVGGGKIRRAKSALGQGSGWNKHKNVEQEIDHTLSKGRWPPNVLLGHAADCTEEACCQECPVRQLDGQSGVTKSSGGGMNRDTNTNQTVYSPNQGHAQVKNCGHGDIGGASRFFPRFHYSSKTSRKERAGSQHPTVKPLAVVEWLIRLTAPPGRPVVLDPFVGSGTTLIAAERLGIEAVGIEQDPEYVEQAYRRVTTL